MLKTFKIIIATFIFVFFYAFEVTSVTGSSSTETNLGTPFLLECRVPENNSSFSPLRLNLTERETDQLLKEGRCFLACALEKFNSEIGMKNYSLSRYWPYIDTSETECDTSSNVHECTRGCIQALQNEEETLSACFNTCIDNCSPNEDCDSLSSNCHPWIHSGCPLTCNVVSHDPGNPCILGCKLPHMDWDDHFSNDSVDNIPDEPVGAPTLIPNRNTGQFTVDLISASPQLESGSALVNQMDVSAVVFLFKIEERSSHEVTYNWTVSPYVQLDLARYACMNVSVSFAVSSTGGLTNFSQTTQVTVHGDERLIPNPPTDLQVSEEIDKRIGLFGHVILNISWESPQNDAYVDNFTLSITTTVTESVNKCGRDAWSTTVSHDMTAAAVKANRTLATSLPVISCTYFIQIHAVGQDGKSNPLETLYNIETRFDPNSITYECQRLWDPPEFSFNLTWILPDYLRHGNIITNFVVTPTFRDGSEITTIPIDSVTVPFPKDMSQTTGFSKILYSTDHNTTTSFYTPQARTSRLFRLETYIMWNSSSIPYVPPAHLYTCELSALSPAPSLVENFTVISFFTDGPEVTLSLEWSPPEIINGQLASYDICIGQISLEPEDDVSNDGVHECSRQIIQENATVIEYFPRLQYPLYVQIRAHNLYVSGNWSDPIVLNATVEVGVTSTDQHMTTAGITEVPGTSTHTMIIIGSSVGGVLILALLVCFLCLAICCVRISRRKQIMLQLTQETCDPIFMNEPALLHCERPLAVSMNASLVDEWEIPAKEVIMEKLLGEGAFGEVYKGIIKCPIVNPKVRSSVKNSICTPVAIKLLKLAARGNERQDFLSEIEMMKKVAEGQNPHVVCLVGCVTIQEPLCLITEFVKYGDLLSYLRTNRRMFSGNNDEDESDTYLELGNVVSIDLISFAYQVASGMEYLSSLGIVHRDLAARNILVDEGKVLKISDLGMSRETDEIYVMKRTGRVPLKWMAIESIIAREFTSASDVWSYGVTLWEIGTLGGFPYPTIQNDEFLPLLKRGYRMEKPDNCSPEVYEIMLKCWDEQPHNRPTFSELRSTFDAMLLADKKDEYIDLHIDHRRVYYQQMLPLPKTNGDSGSFKSFNTYGQDVCGDEDKASKPSIHFDTSSMQSTKNNKSSRQYLNSDQCIAAASNESDRTYQNTGRPVSMYLPCDKKERENPYVDEPSHMCPTSLTLPNTNGWPTQWSSDGAIEMNQFSRSSTDRRKEEHNQVPEIHICLPKD